MHSLRFGLVGLVASAGWFTSGCDAEPSGAPAQQPIESQAATTTINQRIDDLLGGLGDTTAQVDTTESATVATETIERAAGGPSGCPVTDGSGSGAAASGGSGIGDVPKSTTDALDDFLHQLVQEAKDHLFRQEYVEHEDGMQVIYKVDPNSACGSNARCLEKLTANPVRFAVTASTDDSLDVSVLVGAARIRPGAAVLGPSKLSVRVDLAAAMDAVRLYVDAADQQDLPERLAGAVTGSIEKRAADEFVLSAAVVEKLDLLVGQAKGKPVAVTVFPSDPTALLTINSTTDTLGYAVNLSAVDVSVAGAAVCDDSCGDQEKTGNFSGHLAGYTGAVTLTKGAQELTVAGLGLGATTSYVALNGNRLGALDLNPAGGRKLSVTFKKVAEGTLVTFDPALDIKLAITLSKLSESLRVDLPAWLNDEIFDVILGGAAKPQVLVPAATCDASGNITSKSQLEVVTGELHLNASSLASPVTVPAGMCLVPVDGAGSDTHPMSQVRADVCQ